MDTSTCQQARLNAGQAPNNSNEAKIAVAALTVVKFIYSEKTKKIEEISLLVLFLLMSLMCHRKFQEYDKDRISNLEYLVRIVS